MEHIQTKKYHSVGIYEIKVKHVKQKESIRIVFFRLWKKVPLSHLHDKKIAIFGL